VARGQGRLSLQVEAGDQGGGDGIAASAADGKGGVPVAGATGDE
jgi:hypothetical protein